MAAWKLGSLALLPTFLLCLFPEGQEAQKSKQSRKGPCSCPHAKGLSLSPPSPLWLVCLTTHPDSRLLAFETQVQTSATKVLGALVRCLTIVSSVSQMSNSVHTQAQVLPIWQEP